MLAEADGTRTAKRRALARRRLIAGALLLFAGLVFLVMQALPPVFLTRLVAAAAEAALVGGLADWFAVTAIFRRPLGLPIPHTALIPRRKDEIGRALGAFVRDNFLEPTLVVERLRAQNRARQIARWLKGEAAGKFVAGRGLALAPVLLDMASDPGLRARAGEIVLDLAGRIDPAPMLDAAIDALIASGKHRLLIDAAVELGRHSLSAAEPVLLDKIGAQTGRFFPRYFDRKIAQALVDGARAWLEALRAEDSPERAQAEGWLRGALTELRAAPGYRPRIAELRDALFGNDALRQFAGSAFEEFRSEIEADLASPAPRLETFLRQALVRMGGVIESSPALQDSVNAALERVVLDYIAPWRAGISRFIEEVVASWDTQTVVDLIELEAGSDLQYVRINGTVVGALIGVLLFLLTTVL